MTETLASKLAAPTEKRSAVLAHTQPVVVYSAASQMNTPGVLLREMWQDLFQSRELAWRLAVRDISAQYRQSLLGIFWAFVPPILSGLVFIFLNSRNVLNLGETAVPYAVFALVGTILWQMFVESLNAPLKAVAQARPMLAKIKFPREALIIAAFYTLLFSLLIKLAILLVILLVFQIPFAAGMLLALPAVLMLMLLGITLGLFLTPLDSLYTDVSSALPVVVQLLFFVTPVVYPPPQSWPYSLLATLNPIAPLLLGTRDLLTLGTLTNSGSYWVVSGLTLLALLIAWPFYRLALPIVIERMSA